MASTTSLTAPPLINPNSSSHDKHHHHLLHYPAPSNSAAVSQREAKLSLSATAPSVAPPLKPVPSHRPKRPSSSALAARWREIHGCDDWEDLVEPLDPLLRREIVRYGEFVMACYDAFDLDQNSKRYLNCKYGKAAMFREVGLGGCGYEVTRYIYATPGIGTCRGHWVGYVAVAGDEEARRIGRRDIVVSFRGTAVRAEWIANLMSSLTPARLDPQDPRPDVKVESGFLSLYTSDDSSCRFGSGSCREQLLSEVSRLINVYRDRRGEEVSITLAGHSMGSSLALLLGYDLAELGLNREVPIAVYSYGGPRVGNLGFKRRCEELGVKVLRVVNVNDPVTKMPGVVFNESFRLPWSNDYSCYAHVGVEIALDFFKMKNPACVHDLAAYIGLLKFPKDTDDRADNLIIEKAKALVGRQARRLSAWQWQDAAMQVGELVQSLRI